MRKELKALGPLTDIKQMVERLDQLYSNKIMISEKKDGVVVSYSAKKIREDVESLAVSFMELGLAGDNIVVIGENSYAWLIAYFAVVCSGNVAVPLDKELTDDGIARLTAQADARAFIYSDTFSACAKAALNSCDTVEYTIGMYSSFSGSGSFGMEDLIKQGKRSLRRADCPYREIKMNPEDVCEIIFTSGTTGANKGVMLSHKNVCTVLNAIVEMFPVEPSTFSVLPLSHTYEKNCNVLGALCLGTKVYFNDSLKYLVSNMDLFKPHMSCMVPLLLDVLYKNIWSSSKKMGLEKHLKLGLRISTPLKYVGVDLREKLFQPITNKFGGNFRFVICGGAPLNPDLLKGLNHLGFNIANGYGITECAPLVSVNLNSWWDPESVGAPIPGVQVKIGDKDGDGNGEILVKGGNVMVGYYKDPESTQASFDEDGWFKTGDFGHLDSRGRIVVAGRKKNLIILDNGKNVHPEEIETIVLDSVPYIKEVVVHAAENESSVKEGKQQIIAAEVFMDPDYIEQNKLENLSDLIAEDIRRVNKKLPVYKQIHYIGISDQEFEKTTTKKIRRFKVIDNVQQNSKVKIM